VEVLDLTMTRVVKFCECNNRLTEVLLPVTVRELSLSCVALVYMDAGSARRVLNPANDRWPADLTLVGRRADSLAESD
jgi:hypothetical protein